MISASLQPRLLLLLLCLSCWIAPKASCATTVPTLLNRSTARITNAVEAVVPFGAQLIEKSSQRPLANQPVVLEDANSGRVLSTKRTDSSGWVTFNHKLPSKAADIPLRMRFLGTSKYSASASSLRIYALEPAAVWIGCAVLPFTTSPPTTAFGVRFRARTSSRFPPLVGVPVELRRRLNSSSGWELVATSLTERDGNAWLEVSFGQAADFNRKYEYLISLNGYYFTPNQISNNPDLPPWSARTLQKLKVSELLMYCN